MCQSARSRLDRYFITTFQQVDHGDFLACKNFTYIRAREKLTPAGFWFLGKPSSAACQPVTGLSCIKRTIAEPMISSPHRLGDSSSRAISLLAVFQ
jgi:hypothetical protein